MKSQSPNPAGRHGKPIILPPMKFEDALRKILASPPLPDKDSPKPAKKKRVTRKK